MPTETKEMEKALSRVDDKETRLYHMWKALRHFSHPAHHVDENAAGIEFSRADAVCFTAMVAAFLTRHVREHVA
jgi:hypothetical protein